VSSDLLRASATADRISAGRTRLADRPQLREFDFGAWDGLTFDAVAGATPNSAVPSGTHRATSRRRGAKASSTSGRGCPTPSRTLAADHPGADLIAVAHMGVILAISAFRAVSG
jgi:alpha-ribazole phosphatase